MATTSGSIKAISVSKEKGTQKVNVPTAELKTDFGIIGDALMDKPVERSPVNTVDDFEDYLALSLDRADHCGLVTFIATAIPSCLATNPRLIDFYDAFEGERIGISHGGTYAMAEIPSGFVGDAQDSLKLLGADTLLGFHHEQYSHEPLTEREFGIMENGSSKNGELVAA